MDYNEDETANRLANILAEKLEKEFQEKYIVERKYNVCYMAKIIGYNNKGIPVFEEADGKNINIKQIFVFSKSKTY